MLQIFEMLYRSKGTRRIQNLIMPKTFDITTFQFSRNAVFHSVSHDDSLVFPDPNANYLTELNKRIFTEHITDLTSKRGNPRKLNTPPITLFKPFHYAHKNFKFLRDARVVNKNQSSLDVVNYGLLQDVYKYPPMPMSNYFKWFNIEKTVWDTIKTTCNETDRQNFIFFNIPDLIPSLTLLRLFSVKENTSLLKVFNTSEKLSVLEFYKWIDPVQRASSTLGEMTADEMRKINIVFVSKGHWTLLNLSYLNNWIINEDAKDGEINTPTSVAFKPAQMQKFFLRMLMTIQNSNIIKPEDEIDAKDPDAVAELDAAKANEENEQESEDGTDEHTDISHNVNNSFNEKVKANATLNMVADEIEVSYDDVVDLDTIMADMDADLETLEKVAKKDLQTKGLIIQKDDVVEHDIVPITSHLVKEIHDNKGISVEEVKAAVYSDVSDQEVLMNHIEEASEYGVMSASEYRTTKKIAENFTNLKSPYSKDKSLIEFGVIKPEDTKLDIEGSKLKDTAQIIDKTMLESRLQVFDKHYIKKVMKKNIVNAVTSVRRAGIIIQDYDIENESSILGDFEIHTLRLKPIEGASSTVRFKLPVVSEDGYFMNSGNKYLCRKQKAPMPICKVSSSEIGLTSYYGKIFVNRSVKKVNDFGDWLVKQIFSLGFSSEPTVITKLAPADVFVNDLKAPKIYTILSKNFKSLNVDGYTLILDRTEILNLFKEPEPNTREMTRSGKLNIKEGDDLRLIGYTPKKEFLYVNYNDIFVVESKDGVYTEIGDFCTLANIAKTNAPVDFSVVKIYSKPIPVVLVLGYLLGLDNVIKLLDVELNKDIRFVEGNKRVDLGKDEFVIAFSDRKMVINRNHKLASIILAGFNEYYKVVKNYEYHHFNNKDVYFNLLDSANISARYMKEIDLLDQMFIDPITKELLLQDKYPVTFKGLLVYCSELLTTDYYTEGKGTERIRGYERFSGAIYKELVGSIRNFKGRGIRGKSAIELNPYAVWKTITQDAANILVADINPIENLKQMEYVTLTGEGGRDKGAINKEARLYKPSDMGTISEATVDSSDVAINTYLSANPLFNSVYGTSDEYDFNKNGGTSLVSTSALIAVGSDHDD